MESAPGGKRRKKVRQSGNTKVLCGCGCDKRLSSAQRARHMRGLAPRFIAASSAHRRAADLTYIRTGVALDDVVAPAYLNENIPTEESDGAPHTGLGFDSDLQEDRLADDPNENIENDDISTMEHRRLSNFMPVMPVAPSATQRQMYHERTDNSSDSDTDTERDLDENLGDEWDDGPSADDDPFAWTLVNEQLVDERGLTAEELLGEDFEREAANNENRINEADISILRAFQYKHSYFLSRSAFQALPFVFPQVQIPSIGSIRTRISFLSGINAVAYDCCVNSCCCFLGMYKDDESCRFCGELRYAADGKSARKKYTYTPLIPRLCGMFENKVLCKELRYRHEYELSKPPNNQHSTSDANVTITDIWDGEVYKNLKNRHIKVNGEELHARYFSDLHDIALGLSTDGFSPWRKRKYTAWPLLIFNYSLPPENRFHQNNIIALSVIPGPKKPKDIDSFLYPLVEELLTLAYGVRAYDASTEELFCLRAFLIIAFGDIPAVSLLMKMKGHNAITPCRSCNIKGLRVPGSDATVHYIPLERASHPDAKDIPEYDPHKLPMRTHEEFLSNAHSVVTARTRAQEDTLGKLYGIKGKTILTTLDSLSFPHSFPYDFMHLIYENVLKNLVLLWTNDFKGLNTGTGNYALSATVWDAIGAATAKASDTIPSAYCARLGSISGDRSTFTADNYSFWALYIGPILLQRKFNHPRYYDHFVQLVKLLLICLKYEYTSADVIAIRDGFVNWVVSYEHLYYQHSPARLSTCPLTIHALLHIADGIEACGPVWAYWAFPMERYCGLLQRAVLSSRRHPYITLDKYIAEDAMLTQLKMRYNLYSELSLRPQQCEDIGYRVPGYPTCELLPLRSTNPLPHVVRDRIAAALATRYNVLKTTAKHHVPDLIEQWGKVRRIDLGGGDTMVAALLGKNSLDKRDATHIRYQTLVDLHARNRKRTVVLNNKTFYGQLLRIFCLTVEASPRLKLSQPEKLILVEIQSCKIISHHRDLDIHYYKLYGTPSVLDVTCVQCLVGRVKLDPAADSSASSSEWAIFDRSGTLAQAFYAEEGSSGDTA